MNSSKIYNFTKRLKLEEDEQYFPGFLYCIDYIKQQIPRPVAKEKEEMDYSGKKKRHTVKTQIMVNNRRFIIHKTDYKKGRRRDYNIYKYNHLQTPKQVVNVFNLGNLGAENDFLQQLSYTHRRKKRNILQLSKEQKRIQ